MSRYSIFVSSLVLVTLLGLGSVAQADKRGKDLIACLDKKANLAKDQYFVYDMVIHEPGRETRTLVMNVWVTGSMRLVHFVSPGDVKGTKVLIRARDQMYVWLPAYAKIRRITSHAKKQSLFGADYNYDDQSTVRYGDVFDPQFLGKEGELDKVRVKATSRSDSPYGYIDLYLNKDCLPVKLLYYNDKGKHLKTETRDAYSCQDVACTSAVMKMVDHTRNNHWTKMIRKEWKVNTGVSKRKFSRRALQRSF